MSEAPIEVTNASAFEEASLSKQVALSIFTIGFYNLYWFYKTSEQLVNGTNADEDPTAMTVLLFIPIYGLWNFAEVAQAVTDQDHMIVFLLFVFSGGIGGWLIVQSGINDLANDAAARQSPSGPGAP